MIVIGVNTIMTLNNILLKFKIVTNGCIPTDSISAANFTMNFKCNL